MSTVPGGSPEQTPGGGQVTPPPGSGEAPVTPGTNPADQLRVPQGALNLEGNDVFTPEGNLNTSASDSPQPGTTPEGGTVVPAESTVQSKAGSYFVYQNEELPRPELPRKGLGEKPTTNADTLQGSATGSRGMVAAAIHKMASDPRLQEIFDKPEGLGEKPTNEAGGLLLHEGPAQWPRGARGQEQPRNSRGPLSLGKPDVFDAEGNLQGQPTPEGFGQKPTNDAGKPVSVDEWRQKAEEVQRAIESGAIKIDPKKIAPFTEHPYWGRQYETGSSPEEIAQAVNRRVTEWVENKANSDPSSKFYEQLRETFRRVEATGKLTARDKDILLVGSREFAKDAAGVEDTSDMSLEAQMFQLAQTDYLGWVLDKIR